MTSSVNDIATALPMGGYRALRNNTHPQWWRDQGLRRLSGFTLLGYLGTVNTGYDGSLMNGLLTMPIFVAAIDNAKGSKLGIITAIYSLGCLIGLNPASWFSDKWGRKKTILVGALLCILGGLVQGCTKGPWAMLGGRFVIGLGSAFETIAAPTLVTELAHPRMRAQATALTQTCWFIGSIIAAWSTFGSLYINNDWCWRIPCLLQCAPGIIQIAGLWWCPESPRYLLSNGKEEQALSILATYHANGEAQDELVQYEFMEMKNAIVVDKAAGSTISYSSFFKTKGNRHRLAILVLLGFLSQWMGNGIISYYLASILTSIGFTNPNKQAGLNGGLQVWNWLLAISGALATERLGRRFLWLTSAIGMLITFIVITACSAAYANTGKVAAGYVVIAALFLYNGSFAIAFTPMALSYPVEILPYSLRTKGLGISQSCVYLALVFNQYVNPVALDALAWKYYILYCCLIALMIVIIYYLFPETRGRTLEEIEEIFDGPTAPTSEADDNIEQIHIGEQKKSSGHLEGKVDAM